MSVRNFDPSPEQRKQTEGVGEPGAVGSVCTEESGVTGKLRKLHKEEFHNLNSLPNIIIVMNTKLR
jgi:hypothetical protein